MPRPTHKTINHTARLRAERPLSRARRVLSGDAATDILGGAWLVTLVLTLMHLPGFVA